MFECIVCKPLAHLDKPQKTEFGFIHRDSCGMASDDIPEWQRAIAHKLMYQTIEQRDKKENQ